MRPSAASVLSAARSPSATAATSLRAATVQSAPSPSARWCSTPGANLDYDINDTFSLDQIVVANSGGLTINGGKLNINGGTSAFMANGVYNLISFSGAIRRHHRHQHLTVNPTNKNTATNTYAFGTAGKVFTLTIASTGGFLAYWNVDSDGNWSANSNWTTPAAPVPPGAHCLVRRWRSAPRRSRTPSPWMALHRRHTRLQQLPAIYPRGFRRRQPDPG